MIQYTTMTAHSLHDFVQTDGEVATVNAVGAGDREVTLPPNTVLIGIHRFSFNGLEPFVLLSVKVEEDPMWEHPDFTMQFRLTDDARVAVYANWPERSNGNG